MLSAIVGFFGVPDKTNAYSPIIAECVNNLVGGDNWYYSSESNVIKQLIDVRLDEYDIDALAFKIKADGGPVKATASIIKRDGPIISSVTVDVTTTESWVYFDLPDKPIPRGIYYIQVIGINGGKVAWRYGPNTCIGDSFAVINGVSQSVDMGFGVYAYDTTTASTPDQPQNPASSTQSTTLPGESSTNTVPNSNSTTINNSGNQATPSSDSTGTTNSNQTSSANDLISSTNNSNVDASLTQMGPWAIAWFVGWGLIILLIFFLWRRKKKKDENNIQINSTKNEKEANEK